MKIQLIFGFCFLMTLITTPVIGAVNVIKAESYKDGGSVCVKYEKQKRITECCIDHREKKGKGLVYVGGLPDNNKEARIASKEEIKSIYHDLSSLTENSLKNLSTISKLEFQGFMKQLQGKLKH